MKIELCTYTIMAMKTPETYALLHTRAIMTRHRVVVSALLTLLLNGQHGVFTKKY